MRMYSMIVGGQRWIFGWRDWPWGSPQTCCRGCCKSPAQLRRAAEAGHREFNAWSLSCQLHRPVLEEQMIVCEPSQVSLLQVNVALAYLKLLATDTSRVKLISFRKISSIICPAYLEAVYIRTISLPASRESSVNIWIKVVCANFWINRSILHYTLKAPIEQLW